MVRALLVTVCLGVVGCDGGPEVPAVSVSALREGRLFYDPNAPPPAAVDAVEPEVGAASVALEEALAADPAATESGDPLAKFGWTRDRDGYIQVTYLDLALDGLDQELLVEKLLYPEDYADEAIDWPERIKALDGEKVALTGYMLPLLWKDTTVPHFMLVRDLMSCCFGGSPKPDEWCDVKMQGEGAGYWSYVPVIARGTFHLTGIADEAGYAAGGYALEGHDVRREL